MGKKDENCQKAKEEEKVQSVLELVKKTAPPLSAKQERFCEVACVERFLKAKGDNVKKAAKQLRNCLAWRDSLGTDHLTADEFSAELSDGMAYVAGLDMESRPVMVFRIKQDYHKFNSQKHITRLLVFTLEVAIQTMTSNVQQLVLLFDAGFFRSASSFINMLLGTLKIIGDYYPGRLYKAFIIDPPLLFSYLWKGAKPFVELSNLTMVISSQHMEEALLEFDGSISSSRHVPPSLDAPSTQQPQAKLGSCSSSRFTFTVSHNLDSLKPWYLSLTDHTTSSKVGPTISSLNARSHSFASPVDRAPRGYVGKGFFPSTPLPQKTQKLDLSMIHMPRTPKPYSTFLMPPLFQKGRRVNKSLEPFLPFVKFYQRPYDESIYRSKMRPPLGGLVSIVSPQLRRSRQVSSSQRFQQERVNSIASTQSSHY